MANKLATNKLAAKLSSITISAPKKSQNFESFVAPLPSNLMDIVLEYIVLDHGIHRCPSIGGIYTKKFPQISEIVHDTYIVDNIFPKMNLDDFYKLIVVGHFGSVDLIKKFIRHSIKNYANYDDCSGVIIYSFLSLFTRTCGDQVDHIMKNILNTVMEMQSITQEHRKIIICCIRRLLVEDERNGFVVDRSVFVNMLEKYWAEHQYIRYSSLEQDTDYVTIRTIYPSQ
jgi:hypothetical protein